METLHQNFRVKVCIKDNLKTEGMRGGLHLFYGFLKIIFQIP
jgi:hypothetical protein